MNSLQLFFILVILVQGYLESIDPTKFNLAESCFDAKLSTPSRNCSTEALTVLKGLNASFFEIESTYKTVTRKRIMGLSTGLLNVFASSSSDTGKEADQGRMISSSSWCSDSTTETELFFQIGSPIPAIFNSLELNASFTVKINSFMVKYTLDGINWANYNLGQIFQVNSDYSIFVFIPFTARAIRIYILNPQPSTCAKFEVLITPLENQKVLSPGNLIAALNSGFKVSSSSVYSSSQKLKNAYFEYKIVGEKSWCASSSLENQNQWIGVSSPIKMSWKKIHLKSSGNTSYIKTFKIAYSDNGNKWKWYQNGAVLSAMSSTQAEAIVNLTPFEALAIRVFADSWDGDICTRIEFYCSEI